MSFMKRISSASKLATASNDPLSAGASEHPPSYETSEAQTPPSIPATDNEYLSARPVSPNPKQSPIKRVASPLLNAFRKDNTDGVDHLPQPSQIPPTANIAINTRPNRPASPLGSLSYPNSPTLSMHSDASAIFERDIETHERISAQEAVDMGIPPALDDAVEAFTTDDPSNIEIITAAPSPGIIHSGLSSPLMPSSPGLTSPGLRSQLAHVTGSEQQNPWADKSSPPPLTNASLAPNSASIPSSPLSPRIQDLSNSPDKRRISFISYADMLNERAPSPTSIDRVASSGSLMSLGLDLQSGNTGSFGNLSLSETLKNVHSSKDLRDLTGVADDNPWKT